MRKSKIKLIDENCRPIKMSEGAACYDVFARKIEFDEAKSTHIVKLGFKATPPEGYKFVLVPRSGINKTHLVMQNTPGQGDPDYTGEYQMRFKSLPTGVSKIYYESNRPDDNVLTYDKFPFKEGNRVGQMFIQKIEGFEWEDVEELNETTRGAGGFGSSGL